MATHCQMYRDRFSDFRRSGIGFAIDVVKELIEIVLGWGHLSKLYSG